jgi:hypothetical protein
LANFLGKGAEMATSEARIAPKKPLSDVVRARLRARIAEEGWTHEQVAERLQNVAENLYGRRHGFRFSRRKVTDVIAGRVELKIREVLIWAVGLNTSEPYLLGFTFDPTPEQGTLAAMVNSANPG